MKRRRPSSRTLMVIALRAAARDIALEAARKAAAAEADRIPRWSDERFRRGVKGRDLMPMARGLLRSLPHQPQRALAGCAKAMRELADMLDAPSDEVSFEELGKRKPRIAA